MRIAYVVVTVVGVIMMMYFTTFVFGSMFDEIEFAALGIASYGKPAWIATALERFELINVCGLAISIGMIVWGFMNAIRVGEYTRRY